MFPKLFLIATVFGLTASTSVGVYDLKEDALPLGHDIDLAQNDAHFQPQSQFGLEHVASSYSGPNSYQTSGDHSIGTGGGDFHHGVSVVGGGGDNHGTTFDLTHHGNSHHTGPFGGSFVASAKYEGHPGIAQKVSEAGGHESVLTFGNPHYTDVLQASDNGDGQNADKETYKWGFGAPVHEY